MFFHCLQFCFSIEFRRLKVWGLSGFEVTGWQRQPVTSPVSRAYMHACMQLLPPSVAAQLKAGLPVSSRSYASATVLFIDICRFTDMCAQSTPLQIVTLLNGLFTQFDTSVVANNAYKVQFKRVLMLRSRWRQSVIVIWS
jgi:class 3 adenylate cyclase